MAVCDQQPAAAFAQRRIQLHQRLADEFHAPAASRRLRGKDVGVEHEHAPHLPGLRQGVVEGGMIGGAQVAAKPHQGALEMASQRRPGAGLACRTGPRWSGMHSGAGCGAQGT